MNRQENETLIYCTDADNIIKYLKHLDPIEKQAYTIGIHHLGSSFNVVKSNGYIEWTKNNK